MVGGKFRVQYNTGDMSTWSELVAVVLAGGSGDRMATDASVDSKGLVPFRGIALGTYVLEALAASRSVQKVVLVGPAGLPGPADLRVGSGERMIDSLAIGCEAARRFAPSGLLVMSCDLPWLRGEALDRWVEEAPKADLVYPVIPEEISIRYFPRHKRTFVRLRSGRFTGGNICLIRPCAIASLIPWIDRVYRARKNPLALARIIGFGTALRFLLGQVTLASLEREVGRKVGLDVRVSVTNEAAIGADVDRPEHIVNYKI
jgi:molybdopterin-guanine dinucleotide biosynthesis protein A